MDLNFGDFHQICRICLARSRNLTSIFLDTNNICHKMLSLVKIEISEDDNLPSQICSKCISSLNFAYNFQVLCQNSDVKLREIASNQPTAFDGVSDIAPMEENISIKVEANLSDHEFDEYLTLNVNNNNKKLPVHRTRKRKYTRRKPLKRHQCDPCSKVFNEKKSLDYHNLRIHGIAKSERKKNMCQICHECFDIWQDLAKHEKELKHYAKVNCHICNKSFSRSYLSEHLQSHTDSKSYLCNLCGKNFNLLSSFKKHSFSCGIAEKNFKCSACDSSFHTLGRLREHEKIHTEEKPFVCESCGKKFRTKDKLVIHQLTHSDLKPYPCEFCGRSFRQRIHLKEHSRIHTGEKPFICSDCGAGFTQGHCLKQHRLKACFKPEIPF